ncbi:MAG: hypothetical protein C4583_05830 [Anaerolineaceae bacterium]|nr:MAG: hypothetical protein C4583_05830 [Anaerolineaceae bacterium]
MSDKNLSAYLAAARAAVDSVKASLRYGAGNRADDREATYQRERGNFENHAEKLGYGPGSVWAAGQLSRYVAEIKVIAMRLEDFFGALPALPASQKVQRIRQISDQAKRYGAGNCSDQACVAFIELYDAGIRPLDIMYLTNGKHGFVAIGKEAAGNEDPSTWGGSTVICDPWNHDAYHLLPGMANGLLLTKMNCNCSKASSQIRV